MSMAPRALAAGAAAAAAAAQRIIVYHLYIALLLSPAAYRCAETSRRLPQGIREVWLSWRGEPPAPGQIAQTRLCPPGRWVTELVVTPAEVVVGSRLPSSAAGVPLPHAAVQALEGYCTKGGGSDPAWQLLPADMPEVPFIPNGELLLGRLPTTSTVYSDSSSNRGMVNVTTVVAANGSAPGAWVSGVSLTNAITADGSDDLVFIDVCPPGMFISGYQVNQAHVIMGISWACSCRDCGCECTTSANTTCRVRPISPGLPAKLPWCILENASDCPLRVNPPTPPAALGSWFWCPNVTSTSIVLAEQTVMGCTCASSFDYRDDRGDSVTLVRSAGSCITTNSTPHPWCYVMAGSCPVNVVLPHIVDARGESLPYDNCTGGAGLAAAPVAVTNRQVSPTKEGSGSRLSIGIWAIVISAVVVVGCLMLLGCLRFCCPGVLSRLQPPRKEPTKPVAAAEPKADLTSPFASDDAQKRQIRDFDSAKNREDPLTTTKTGESELVGKPTNHTDFDPEDNVLESLPTMSARPSWRLTPASLKIVKHEDGTDWLLGSGAYGKVYRGLLNRVQPVAIKVMDSPDEASRQAVAKEIAILKESRNPHIVQFLGACIDDDGKMLVVMELMDQGTLFSAIADGRVSWYSRGRKIALDIARGIAFLHSHNIVHLDIKSGNVLLARNLTAKISDVGLARVLHTQMGSSIKGTGTFQYAAPEVLMGGMKVSEAADIYSYGVVLWELVTTEVPTRGNLREVRVPEECPQEVYDLFKQCLLADASKRPTADDIVLRLSDVRLGRKPSPQK